MNSYLAKLQLQDLELQMFCRSRALSHKESNHPYKSLACLLACLHVHPAILNENSQACNCRNPSSTVTKPSQHPVYQAPSRASSVGGQPSKRLQCRRLAPVDRHLLVFGRPATIDLSVLRSQSHQLSCSILIHPFVNASCNNNLAHVFPFVSPINGLLFLFGRSF